MVAQVTAIHILSSHDKVYVPKYILHSIHCVALQVMRYNGTIRRDVGSTPTAVSHFDQYQMPFFTFPLPVYTTSDFLIYHNHCK